MKLYSPESQRAARIAQVRQRARTDLLTFCQYMMLPDDAEEWELEKSGYIVGKPQRELCGTLERVRSGEIKRLIVTMPPQLFGKSTTCSQMFPIQWMGQEPTLEVLQTGYADRISLMHSTKARDFFVSKRFRALFPDSHHAPGQETQGRIAIERQAAHEWKTVQGGRYFASGLLGGISGNPFGFVLIDDPVKNQQEADSAAYIQQSILAYQAVVRARLSPGAPIVLVMTRWGLNDLAGQVLAMAAAAPGGDQWHVLKIPAQDADGQSPFPEKWSTEEVERIRLSIAPRIWSSLFMCSPTVAGGSLIKEEWFRESRYNAHEPAWRNRCVARVDSWDTAQEIGDENAYTACVTGELSPEYTAAVSAVMRTKVEFTDLLDLVIRTSQNHNRDNKLSAVLIEKASTGGPLIQTLMSQGPEWLKPLIVPVTVSKSKDERTMAASTWCFNGSVLLPRPHDCVSWLHDFEAELFAVPATMFRDQADAFAQLVWYWEPMLTAGLETRGVAV